jgi:hypothetical protein
MGGCPLGAVGVAEHSLCNDAAGGRAELDQQGRSRASWPSLLRSDGGPSLLAHLPIVAGGGGVPI